MANLTENAIKKVVRNLLTHDADYRVAIVATLNAQFMDFVIDFFQRVVRAKMKNQTIDTDWYKAAFIDNARNKSDIATNAGINLKTIGNIRGTERREVVISAANQNYEEMKDMIDELVREGEGVDITISIAFNKVSVELSINESLVVINALAVKRAALSGGIWSSVGKQTEGVLMLTLCDLFSVAREHYDLHQKRSDRAENVDREIDFFLVNGETRNKCEVKLIGRGNPENADAVIARGSKVYVADTMSDQNITQMNFRKVLWVHLKAEEGYLRFGTVLKNLGIPHTPYRGNLEKQIGGAIERAFAEKKKSQKKSL